MLRRVRLPLLLLLTALLLACSDPPASAPAPPAEAPPETPEQLVARLSVEHPDLTLVGVHPMLAAGPLEHYRLPNGMAVFYQRDAFSPSAVVQTWVAAGSRDDPEGLSGLAHLLEHLMFREVGGLEDGTFDATMERLGVESNAYTWFDYTLYEETVPRASFAEVIALEAGRLRQFEVSDAVLEAERKVVLSERAWRVDGDPGGVMLEAMYARIFPNHPYRLTPTGTVEGIRAATAKDARDFHARHYRPDNITLIVMGDVEREAMLRTVLAHHGQLTARPAAGNAQPQPSPPVDTEVERHVVWMPVDAQMLLLGYRGPRASSVRDRVALEVLVQLLFSSPLGLLSHTLRDELDLASSVTGTLNAMRDGSGLEFMVIVKPGVDEARVREVIHAQLEALTSEALPLEDIDAAKARTELLYRRNLQNPRTRAELVGLGRVQDEAPAEFLERLALLPELSPPEVRRVAGLYLAPQLRTEIVVKPREEQPPQEEVEP